MIYLYPVVVSTVLPYGGIVPQIHPTAVCMPGCVVIGDVHIDEYSSVWFNTIVRGDVHYIRIGKRTNVQDLSMLHVTNGKYALTIGDRVTIGHRAIVHGCTVHDEVLIGMGAILLDGCVVESHSIVAAGSVVRAEQHVPSGVLVAGVPARIVRELTSQEQVMIAAIAEQYVGYATTYSAVLQQSGVSTPIRS